MAIEISKLPPFFAYYTTGSLTMQAGQSHQNLDRLINLVLQDQWDSCIIRDSRGEEVWTQEEMCELCEFFALESPGLTPGMLVSNEPDTYDCVKGLFPETKCSEFERRKDGLNT